MATHNHGPFILVRLVTVLIVKQVKHHFIHGTILIPSKFIERGWRVRLEGVRL